MNKKDSIGVYNVMEDLVEEKLDSCMDMLDMCKCDICRSDVKALALNNLQPRYISRTKGGVVVRAQQRLLQKATDVTTAIMSAASIVKRSPRHD